MEPLRSNAGSLMYQVDGITYTRIPASLEGNGARALVNYELLVVVVCCAHN